MGKSWKIAKWEIKRNLKNKSFLISMFLTPVLILVFGAAGHFFGGDEDGTAAGNGENADSESATQTLYVVDEVGVEEQWERIIDQQGLPIELEWHTGSKEQLHEQILAAEEGVYTVIDETVLSGRQLILYAADDDSASMNQIFLLNMVETLLQATELDAAGLTPEQTAQVLTPYVLEWHAIDEQAAEEMIGKWVPGIFAGVILFAIVITGMMTLHSSMQEKRDKMAETLLSSVTANELMQGKIAGYFLLGLVQVSLWVAIGLPAAQILFDFPILSYLFVPELALYLLYAVCGYLLFAAMYVGLGATIDDFTTAGNFQGLVMMLPFLPFPFIWSVFSNPTGLTAQIGSYFPFTTSAFMIIRLLATENIAWYEIVLSLAALILGVWIMIRLAGKIYRTGMLMYGKNASPAEMWRWIRQ